MAWFKVDDKLHDHRKARKAGKAAMGVWVLAGSWSMDNDTDGFIPDDVLMRWGTATDARALVRAGLWLREEFQGEWGYRFHDWSRFQPSAAVTAAKKAAEAEAGLRGNHKRWHADRGISDPDCEYCYSNVTEPLSASDLYSETVTIADDSRVPGERAEKAESSAVEREIDRVPDRVPDRVGIGGPESGANRPVPEPDPEPHVSPNGETKPGALALVDRDDIRDVCEHLADRIAEDGSKRPAIGKGWHDAARLMLDKDGRSVDEVHAAIDWCQNHHFWRANILSMPKLREKFDQLRKQAIAERTKPATSRNSEFQAQQERAMARAIERERQMGIR